MCVHFQCEELAICTELLQQSWWRFACGEILGGPSEHQQYCQTMASVHGTQRGIVTANTEIHELVDLTTFDAILICICHIEIPLQYKFISFLNIEGLLYFD